MVTQHQFLLEIWLEYGFGALVYALRFFARWRLLGFRGWDWDDLFAGVSWVSLIVPNLKGLPCLHCTTGSLHNRCGSVDVCLYVWSPSLAPLLPCPLRDYKEMANP